MPSMATFPPPAGPVPVRVRRSRGAGAGAPPVFAVLLLLAAAGAGAAEVPEAFRVLPHLSSPHRGSLNVTWYTTGPEPGRLFLTGPDGTREFESVPEERPELTYSALEESERARFPDMFANRVHRHRVFLDALAPDTVYRYAVEQDGDRYDNEFRTAPEKPRRIRLCVFADSETDPEGRTTHRGWPAGPQAEGSTGRPEGNDRYLLTETDGFRRNLEIMAGRDPDLLLVAGDIVQGGGYQRAWDEFFFHLAGKFGDLMGRVPLVAAPGNWENFGARNGGYEPAAVASARRKFAAYFDGPDNGHGPHRNFYHRIDYGPVTVITLDSSNALPDGTDNDSNIHIDASAYPGDDLVDAAPGARMWDWCLEQLADARAKGQVIFVQFHHIPYSGGTHSLPNSIPGSTGQAGYVMRAYTPWFQKHGVAAVFCGHNETFEWSSVGDVQFFDAGVGGDGLGAPIDGQDPRRANPWRRWTAFYDEPEMWEGKRLVRGGIHYGHLEVDVEKVDGRWRVTYTPVHAFPLTGADGGVTGSERREAAAPWSHFPGRPPSS
jgi:hypothetical protein